MGKDGAFATVYTRLLDDPDYLGLSSDARFVYVTLCCWPESDATGLFRVFRDALVLRTGLTARRTADAMSELDRSRHAYSCSGLVWVRNRLRFDPFFVVGNPKHASWLVRVLKDAPKGGLLSDFCAYYRGLGYPIPEVIGRVPDRVSSEYPCHAHPHAQLHDHDHAQRRDGGGGGGAAQSSLLPPDEPSAVDVPRETSSRFSALFSGLMNRKVTPSRGVVGAVESALDAGYEALEIAAVPFAAMTDRWLMGEGGGPGPKQLNPLLLLRHAGRKSGAHDGPAKQWLPELIARFDLVRMNGSEELHELARSNGVYDFLISRGARA